jgi:hypothetical protein
MYYKAKGVDLGFKSQIADADTQLYALQHGIFPVQYSRAPLYIIIFIYIYNTALCYCTALQFHSAIIKSWNAKLY